MLNVPEIGCVSVSCKTASAELRGKLAFAEEKLRGMLGQMTARELQCVILCTCCRTEVYFCGSGGVQTAVNMLSENSDISADTLLPYLNIYKDEKAIKHLFRVAGGLSSPVTGEDEILHQTKAAYNLAVSCGAAGFELNRCFQDALACGKKIRSETFISQIPISTATIAANAAAAFGEKVRVLVIGASGNIGSSVLKNLLGHKNVSVSATSRRHGSDIRFGDRVKTVEYNKRYDELALCDCVVSATASPHHTITLHELKKHGISGRKLFIDLAVPADIDGGVQGYGRFERIGIDDIGRLAAQNSLVREDKAKAAAEIIADETDKLKKELIFHWNSSLLNAAEEQMRTDPRGFIFALKKGLGAAEFENVMRLIIDNVE